MRACPPDSLFKRVSNRSAKPPQLLLSPASIQYLGIHLRIHPKETVKGRQLKETFRKRKRQLKGGN